MCDHISYIMSYHVYVLYLWVMTTARVGAKSWNRGGGVIPMCKIGHIPFKLPKRGDPKFHNTEKLRKSNFLVVGRGGGASSRGHKAFFNIDITMDSFVLVRFHLEVNQILLLFFLLNFANSAKKKYFFSGRDS